MNTLWDMFYDQPPELIPWSETQADWLVELLSSGVLKGRSALDIGCGVGAKSTYLAAHGFDEVVGVDIAEKAIAGAREKARALSLEDKCTFYVHDASNLSFLPSDWKFDLVLDWATLHCIPEEHRHPYVTQIISRVKPGGHLLLRTFEADTAGVFSENVAGGNIPFYTLTEADIFSLYGGLEVEAKNVSLPRTKPELKFLEVLFKKAS